MLLRAWMGTRVRTELGHDSCWDFYPKMYLLKGCSAQVKLVEDKFAHECRN